MAASIYGQTGLETDVGANSDTNTNTGMNTDQVSTQTWVCSLYVWKMGQKPQAAERPDAN